MAATSAAQAAMEAAVMALAETETEVEVHPAVTGWVEVAMAQAASEREEAYACEPSHAVRTLPVWMFRSFVWAGTFYISFSVQP